MESPIPNAALSRVDHLVYGTQSLESTVDRLERMLGVRAALGGPHPGKGTRNALLSLGPAVYLEILAPDPAQPEPDGGRWLGLDGLTSPRLLTWAAKEHDLPSLVEHAAPHHIPLGPIVSGSRERPDGVSLSWRLTDPQRLVAEGLVPFFIDWENSPHPAKSAPQGLTLIGLRAEHPDATSVRGMLRDLGLEVPVDEGRSPALIATLRTPRGTIELR